jgi:hypothetical protein
MSGKTPHKKDSTSSPQKKGERGGPILADQTQFQALVGESLSCKICMTIYSAERRPLAMPCGHTFCSVCIETQWNSIDQKARSSHEELKESELKLKCFNCKRQYSRDEWKKFLVIFQMIVEGNQTQRNLAAHRCRFIRNSAKCTYELTHFDRPASNYCTICSKFICDQCMSLEDQGPRTSTYLKDDMTHHPASHHASLVPVQDMMNEANQDVSRMLQSLDSHDFEKPIYEVIKALDHVKSHIQSEL